MDINQKITELSGIVDCPVSQDIYEGEKNRYITFSYEDERPVMYGDNKPKEDIAYLQISYYVPVTYSYMKDKHKIRDFLENSGFKVTSIRCWTEDALTGYQKVRHLLFEVNYTENRRKEE